MAAACTGGGDSSVAPSGRASGAASSAVGSKTIPQPVVTGIPVAPGTERVDLTLPSFSDPTNITNPLFPVSKQQAVLLLGHVDGKPFRTEVTLLPETRIVEWQGLRVETVVSQYVAYLDGRIQEVAYDKYAHQAFEREVPNDLWQIDATRVHLAEGTEVWVLDALDDHARFLLAARAVLALGRFLGWSITRWFLRRTWWMEEMMYPDITAPCCSVRLHGVCARQAWRPMPEHAWISSAVALPSLAPAPEPLAPRSPSAGLCRPDEPCRSQHCRSAEG